MPSVRIQAVNGLVPRVSDRLLPTTAATIADNCKLSSGEIRPYRTPADVNAVLSDGIVQTVYSLNGAWLSWAGDIDVVRGFIPGDTTARFYYTGDGAPKVSNAAMATAVAPYPTRAFKLGVAAPVGAPTVNTGGGGSGVAFLRYYVYTYITAFEEEGPPSFPTSAGDVQDQQAVTVTGFAPPTSENVDAIRIYRTDTSSNGTEYLFVAEIPLGQASYTDTVQEVYLGEKMVSQQWYPPPEGMQGIVTHPSGFALGFVGNQVVASEPYQLHAYPPEYAKVLDYPVVALGVYGNTTVVATTGFTYLLTGADPRNLTVEKLPDPYPCVSKRSLVSGDYGVLYACMSGIVWVGYGGLKVVTRPLMTKEEWKLYNPATIHAAISDGQYIGYYLTTGNDYELEDPQGAGFVFDYTDRATGAEEKNTLTALTHYATTTYAGPDTALHTVVRVQGQNKLQLTEAGTGFIEYKWKSKAFVMPFLVSFATAKVVFTPAKDAEGNTQRVYFSIFIAKELKYTREVTSSQPFRLPPMRRTIEPWYVQVTGTCAVSEIHIATSVEDLKEGKAQ